jgi:hypothetical protein
LKQGEGGGFRATASGYTARLSTVIAACLPSVPARSVFKGNQA